MSSGSAKAERCLRLRLGDAVTGVDHVCVILWLCVAVDDNGTVCDAEAPLDVSDRDVSEWVPVVDCVALIESVAKPDNDGEAVRLKDAVRVGLP